MRKIARTDRNHQDVIKALRSVGCSVLSLHQVGSGCPDLLVARNGKTCLMEVKDGELPPSGRRLTQDEAEFFATWKGECHVVDSVNDAVSIVTEWFSGKRCCS